MNIKPSGYCSQPIIQHRFHFVNPKSMAISDLIHTNTQFISLIMKQTPQTAPIQSRTVQMGSTNSPKIPTIRSQVLGWIKRRFKASNQPNHYKTLKQSITSSMIKPLPHGVCRNSNFLMSTRSFHCVDQLCLQPRRKPMVRFW